MKRTGLALGIRVNESIHTALIKLPLRYAHYVRSDAISWRIDVTAYTGIISGPIYRNMRCYSSRQLSSSPLFNKRQLPSCGTHCHAVPSVSKTSWKRTCTMESYRISKIGMYGQKKQSLIQDNSSFEASRYFRRVHISIPILQLNPARRCPILGCSLRVSRLLTCGCFT